MSPHMLKALALKGYQPNVVGALSYRGGGVRTAYVETSS